MGSTGTTIEGTYGESKESVTIKIVPLGVNIPTEDCDVRMSYRIQRRQCSQVKPKQFEKEVKQTQQLAKLELAPQVKDAWQCFGSSKAYLTSGRSKQIRMGILVMEKVPGVSLRDYVERYKWSVNLQKLIRQLFRDWKHAGWYNHDLTNDHNIWVQFDESTGEPLQVRAIDVSNVFHKRGTYSSWQEMILLKQELKGKLMSTLLLLYENASTTLSEIVERHLDVMDPDADPLNVFEHPDIQQLATDIASQLRNQWDFSLFKTDLIDLTLLYDGSTRLLLKNIALQYKLMAQLSLGRDDELDDDERKQIKEKTKEIQTNFISMIYDEIDRLDRESGITTKRTPSEEVRRGGDEKSIFRDMDIFWKEKQVYPILRSTANNMK